METVARKAAHPAALGEAHAAIACLQRLAGAFTARREQLARAVGLTAQQWAVLEEISREHFMPSLFAEQQESTRGAVSKIIRQLIDKSLISVLVSKDDGRQRKYTLTGKGKRVMDELRAQREQAIDAIWLQLGRDQVLAFTHIGEDIATRLEGYLQRVDSSDTRTKRK